jgi:hypothetical protein
LLTGLVGNDAKFVWGKEQQQAFDEMKKVISKETLLTFPDFNKEFHIYTDASNVQSGAVIMQEAKPLAFYSRKMNAAQSRYTTGEQELLSIIETLKEYQNILLGQTLVVHTDHKNIIYGNLSNDGIARWRLLLEEFGPCYEHIAGKDNVVADALSRMEADFAERKELSNNAKGQIYACALVRTGEIDQSYQLPDANDTEAVAEQIMPQGETLSEKFPLSPALLQKEQSRDKYIQKDLKEKPREFGCRVIKGHNLVTREDKIVVPRRLQGRVVAWYHKYLVHPGETRLEKTLRQMLYWKGLRGHVEGYVKTCRYCTTPYLQPSNATEPCPWIGVCLMYTAQWSAPDLDNPQRVMSGLPREDRIGARVFGNATRTQASHHHSTGVTNLEPSPPVVARFPRPKVPMGEHVDRPIQREGEIL